MYIYDENSKLDLPLPSQHNNPPCKLAHSDPPLSNLPSCHTHRCTPTASYGRLRSNWRGGCLHHQDAPARNCQDGSVAHWHPTSPSHSSQSGWCTLPSFHPHMAAVHCQEMWKVLSKPSPPTQSRRHHSMSNWLHRAPVHHRQRHPKVHRWHSRPAEGCPPSLPPLKSTNQATVLVLGQLGWTVQVHWKQ